MSFCACLCRWQFAFQPLLDNTHLFTGTLFPCSKVRPFDGKLVEEERIQSTIGASSSWNHVQMFSSRPKLPDALYFHKFLCLSNWEEYNSLFHPRANSCCPSYNLVVAIRGWMLPKVLFSWIFFNTAKCNVQVRWSPNSAGLVASYVTIVSMLRFTKENPTKRDSKDRSNRDHPKINKRRGSSKYTH